MTAICRSECLSGRSDYSDTSSLSPCDLYKYGYRIYHSSFTSVEYNKLQSAAIVTVPTINLINVLTVQYCPRVKPEETRGLLAARIAELFVRRDARRPSASIASSVVSRHPRRRAAADCVLPSTRRDATRCDTMRCDAMRVDSESESRRSAVLRRGRGTRGPRRALLQLEFALIARFSH